MTGRRRPLDLLRTARSRTGWSQMFGTASTSHKVIIHLYSQVPRLPVESGLGNPFMFSRWIWQLALNNVPDNREI